MLAIHYTLHTSAYVPRMSQLQKENVSPNQMQAEL